MYCFPSFPGEISITSDMQMIPSLWQKVKRNWGALDEIERGEWKSWLKTKHSKNKGHGIWSITSWKIDGEWMKIVADFIFLGSKITVVGDCSHEVKSRLLLERRTMTNLDSVLKSRDINHFANKDPQNQSYGFSSSHVQLWESDHKEGCCSVADLPLIYISVFLPVSYFFWWL